MSETFLAVIAGVFCANLLTVSVVWGLVAYSRHEKAGTAGQSGSTGPALAVILPMFLMAIAVIGVTDNVPDWLDVILQ